MTKITHIALALATLGFVAQAQAQTQPIKPFNPQIQTGGDLTIDKLRQQNLTVVKKAVEGIRLTLPQKVDQFTQFVAIDSNGTRLIYTFAVDAGPKTDEALRAKGKKMAPRVLKGMCGSADRFIQADIALTYRYVNKATQTEILRVDADKKLCPEKKPNE